MGTDQGRVRPAALGPWQTVWHRYNPWNGDGTRDAILGELIGEIKINQELWCIDGTTVRAAKCAAGGGRKTMKTSRKTTRPRGWAADKGYLADWIDDYLLGLGINPVIPSRHNQDRDARPVPFDKDAYRDRNIVERLIGWLKECRRVFSRFEKTARNFAGMIKMAFIQRYLKLAVE